MAKIVREFKKVDKSVIALAYTDGSVTLETCYYIDDEEDATVLHRLVLPPEGVKELFDMLARVVEHRDEAVGEGAGETHKTLRTED